MCERRCWAIQFAQMHLDLGKPGVVRENLTRGSLEYTELWEVAQRLTERLPEARVRAADPKVWFAGR